MYRVVFGWSNWKDFDSREEAAEFAREYNAKNREPLYDAKVILVPCGTCQS